MSNKKKECFLNEIMLLTDNKPEEIFSEEAFAYWQALTMSDDKETKFTENGIKILAYLQENKEDHNNLFKAKEVGEGLNISSRAASGAMRKLVNDGFLEKIGSNPVVYALTAAGEEIDLSTI